MRRTGAAVLATAALLAATPAVTADAATTTCVSVRYDNRIIDIGAQGPTVDTVRAHLGLPVTPLWRPFNAADRAAVYAFQKRHPYLLRPYTRWQDLRHDTAGTVGWRTYRSILTLPCHP